MKKIFVAGILAQAVLLILGCLLGPKPGTDHPVDCALVPDSTRVDSLGRTVDIWVCTPRDQKKP